MEATFEVRVNVSDEEHARIIRDDIIRIIRLRTTVYHVTKADWDGPFIDEMYAKEGA